MKKVILIVLLGVSLASADKAYSCNWAQNEVSILTKELQYNIQNGSDKSKQDTFNNLADVVQYELVPDCKGILSNDVLMEVVNSLKATKQRAMVDGWWYK